MKTKIYKFAISEYTAFSMQLSVLLVFLLRMRSVDVIYSDFYI